MTSAATTFPVRPPVWSRPAGLLLHCAVGLVVAAWVAALWASDSRAALGWVPLALVAWWFSSRWKPPTAGELRCDGQGWFLSGPASRNGRECEGSLTLSIDAGSWMLLRFQRRAGQGSRAGAVWLLLGEGDSPHEWSALRRAVYSPRLDPAGPSAQAAAHPSA